VSVIHTKITGGAAAIETKHFINAPEAIDEGRLPTAWVGGYLKPFAFDLLAN